LDSAAAATAAGRQAECQDDRAAGRRQKPIGHFEAPLKPLKTHGFPAKLMVTDSFQFA
jgi:hypothetical protein